MRDLAYLAGRRGEVSIPELFDRARRGRNIYTGSLYLGLGGLLHAQAGSLIGQRIGLFSYGSGCTSVPEYERIMVLPPTAPLVPWPSGSADEGLPLRRRVESPAPVSARLTTHAAAATAATDEDALLRRAATRAVASRGSCQRLTT